MWTALQRALLYISTQHKLPGLQTQRKKCELWQDQPFFHFWVPQQHESTRQIVWLGLGWSSVRDRSESSDTMLSDLVAPWSRALIASSKVRPFVWYTWKHGQAQRNLLHGAQRYLVFTPLGFLWHSAQMRCFRPLPSSVWFLLESGVHWTIARGAPPKPIALDCWTRDHGFLLPLEPTQQSIGTLRDSTSSNFLSNRKLAHVVSHAKARSLLWFVGFVSTTDRHSSWPCSPNETPACWSTFAFCGSSHSFWEFCPQRQLPSCHNCNQEPHPPASPILSGLEYWPMTWSHCEWYWPSGKFFGPQWPWPEAHCFDSAAKQCLLSFFAALWVLVPPPHFGFFCLCLCLSLSAPPEGVLFLPSSGLEKSYWPHLLVTMNSATKSRVPLG